MSPPKEVEDEFSVKLDMCLTDGIVKTGTGATLGAVCSVLLFKRRMWPVITGLGVGIGLALSNCDVEFLPMRKQVCKVTKKAIACKR